MTVEEAIFEFYSFVDNECIAGSITRIGLTWIIQLSLPDGRQASFQQCPSGDLVSALKKTVEMCLGETEGR
jgi:hypothetical protein